jgi:elongator complex protein 1
LGTWANGHPGALQILEYASTIASGPVAPPDDFGIIASIDGCKSLTRSSLLVGNVWSLTSIVSLKLTPLRIANIPPPMSLHQLTLSQKAIDVAFSVSSTRLAILSEVDVALYTIDLKKQPVPPPALVWRSEAFQGLCPRHVAFFGKDQVGVLTDAWEEEESLLWVIGEGSLYRKGPILGASQISFMTSGVDSQKLFVHFQDGDVHEVLTADSFVDVTLQTLLATSLPSFAPEAKVILLGGEVRPVSD